MKLQRAKREPQPIEQVEKDGKSIKVGPVRRNAFHKNKVHIRRVRQPTTRKDEFVMSQDIRYSLVSRVSPDKID
jgi:hypothetical protein